MAGLASLFTHYVIYRGGHTVHVEVEGRRTLKLRVRSEEAAAQRLAELAAAIERDGVAALG